MSSSLAILYLLLAWAILFPALCGLGCWVLRLVGLRDRPAADLLALFWIGFAALLILLQAIHLARPITAAVTYPILALGYAGLALPGRPAGPTGWRSQLRRDWFLLPVLAWLALQATAAPEIGDSGLYHFQSIRWANEFRIVPGLGNLEGRFAFNQSYFLYAAFLNVPPLAGRGFHLANSLLAAALLTQMLRALRRTFALSARTPAADLFLALLLPVFIFQLSPILSFRGRAVSSPSPDLPVFIFGILLIAELIALAIPAPADRRPKTERLLLILLAGAAAVTVKLSFLATGLAAIAAAAFAAHRNGLDLRAPALLKGAALAAAGLLLWMARGIVLSGYPLYPSSAFGLPVDWKIPADEVRFMADSIKGWARLPGPQWRDSLHGASWLTDWRRRTAALPDALLTLWIAAAGAALLPLTRLYGARTALLPLWRVLLPSVPIVTGIAFWTLTAPDYRFLGALPWCLAAWLFAAILLHAPGILRTPLVPAALALLSALIALPEAAFHPEIRRDSFGWAVIPSSRLAEFTTRSGLRLYQNNGAAWDHRLPVAVQPNPALELRGPRLQNGFRIAPDRP